MATVFDMATGEVIGASPLPAETPARPVPLHAPGVSPYLCPVVAAAAKPRVLPREVVLSPPAGLLDAED